jgi:hypothetical protein
MTVREDYQARVRASIVGRYHSLEFDRVLSGRQFILSVQVVDLERQEEKLVEDQARGLYPPNGRSLPSELVKLHQCIAGTEDDHAIEAEELSQSIREISNALVNHNVLPIQDIPS